MGIDKSDLIDKKFNVLDKGFIRVVDIMGDDSSVVQAARISYGNGTKTTSDDKNLIRYMYRNFHHTPFEMCEIKLHIKLPLYVLGQWIRHRTASVNALSYRYSECKDEFHNLNSNEWRLQDSGNKQGSCGLIRDDLGLSFCQSELVVQQESMRVYNERLEAGMAREVARKDLPQSLYTEIYWKIDLRNLLNFLYLRTDSHAQKEIRDYANIILEEIVKNWVPLTYSSFMDYTKNSMSLTRLEKDVIRLICSGKPTEACYMIKDEGIFNLNENGTVKNNRELKELQDKLNTLGIMIPWKH